MKLTGGLFQSDISNSLKMGFDLLEMKWTNFIRNQLEIDIQKLPPVVKTGEESGVIKASIATQFQFKPTLTIIA